MTGITIVSFVCGLMFLLSKDALSAIYCQLVTMTWVYMINAETK